MDEYNVKRLTHKDEDDLQFIARIHEFLPEAWINDYRVSEEAIKKTTDELILKHKNEVIFCTTLEKCNNTISFVWAEVNKTNPKQIDIISLWTNEKYRGRGFAKRLKIELEKWAKEEINAEKIHTTVSSKNENMIRLNETLGYKTEYYRMTKYL